MKKNFALFFALTLIITHTFSQKSDSTILKNDSLNHTINREAFWIANAGYEYKNISVSFINLSMNIAGQLYYNQLSASFPKNITNWQFAPILSQNYAFAGLATKYGNFSLSNSIGFNNANQTKMQSFAIDLPYKKFIVGFNYLKMTGFNRENIITNNTEYLKDFTYSPLNIYLGWNQKFYNPLFHLPKKRGVTESSILAGFNQTSVYNATDFIPMLQYDSRGSNFQNISQINNVFVDKFVSKGIYFSYGAAYLIPILKPTINHKCIYFQLKGDISYVFQSYNFHTVSDTLSFLSTKNVQYQTFKSGIGATVSYLIKGDLVFDLNKFILSFKASYQELNFGLGNTSVLSTTNLHISTKRINAYFTLSYRLNAKKLNRKIDDAITKFSKK
ncbi:MAG: hypothetical protein JSU07_11830 [Bacteroidetes bacterium]|nr:hypothetical protein [Bacteroidota bacterium]